MQQLSWLVKKILRRFTVVLYSMIPSPGTGLVNYFLFVAEEVGFS
jgi:hypothetical protein